MLNQVNLNYLLKELESDDCTMFTEQLKETLFTGASVQHTVEFDKFRKLINNEVLCNNERH